ncbi:hypothetical protein ACP70R_023038 [Stipagrostis hirtigluma subsp. patula]
MEDDAAGDAGGGGGDRSSFVIGVIENRAKEMTMARGCFDDTKGAVMDRIRKGIYYEPLIINVTFNGSFDHMNVDSTSVQTLEIIDPLHTELWGTSNKKISLFQMLKTTGGGELMSNEELFFGLTQGPRKFPKESDKVLCHFYFKPKKVTAEVLKPATGRRSQMLISDIVVLKTALDAIPFFSKVLKGAKSSLLRNIYQTVCKNPKYASMRKRHGRKVHCSSFELASVFMTEMKDTAFIMQNVSSKSLIAVDELGRATSSSDGLAIAWSCCEHLLSVNATTLFFPCIWRACQNLQQCKILHFEVDLRNDRLDFKFHLKDGIGQYRTVGFLLAGVAGLPASVVDTAAGITSRITEQETTRMNANREEFRSLEMAPIR